MATGGARQQRQTQHRRSTRSTRGSSLGTCSTCGVRVVSAKEGCFGTSRDVRRVLSASALGMPSIVVSWHSPVSTCVVFTCAPCYYSGLHIRYIYGKKNIARCAPGILSTPPTACIPQSRTLRATQPPCLAPPPPPPPPPPPILKRSPPRPPPPPPATPPARARAARAPPPAPRPSCRSTPESRPRPNPRRASEGCTPPAPRAAAARR